MCMVTRSSQRANTWEPIRRLCFAGPGSWLYGGNFNEVLEACEKSGGMDKGNRGIDEFRRIVDICQLWDLAYEGYFFLGAITGLKS